MFGITTDQVRGTDLKRVGGVTTDVVRGAEFNAYRTASDGNS